MGLWGLECSRLVPVVQTAIKWWARIAKRLLVHGADLSPSPKPQAPAPSPQSPGTLITNDAAPPSGGDQLTATMYDGGVVVVSRVTEPMPLGSSSATR